MSAENIREEINRGGRVVGYLYCVSVVFMTFKRGTDLRLIKAGHNPAGASWPYTLLTLIAGWWGIPWGPIYSIECLYKNLSGGIDVTDDVLRALAPAPAATTAKPAAVTTTPPTLTAAPRPAPSGFNWRIAGLMAGGASLLVLFGVSAYCLYAQQHLTVVLANGLDAPYEVVLNGEKHTLRPYSAEVLELPEGEFTLADVPGAHVVGAEQKIRFATPFFDHLGDAQVAVINPDRCAILIDGEVPYYANSVTPPANEAPAFKLYTNRLTHFLRKPDFVIEPAAQNISMPSGTTRLVKHRLEVAQVTNQRATHAALVEQLGYDAAREHLMLLARQRADEALLTAALTTLKPEDVRAFFQVRLAERPVLLEWHRYYQNTAQRLFPQEDLAAQYRGYLAAHPEDGALHYLLGRVLDEEAQYPHWRAALDAPQPCAYAHGALGYDALSEGRFADAIRHYDAVVAAKLESGGLRHYRQLTLLALDRAADVLPEIATERKAEPLNLETAAREMRYAYAATHEPGAMKKIRNAYLASYKATHPPADQLADTEAFLDAEIAYQTGDLATCAGKLSRFKQPFYAYRRALLAGDCAAAEKIADADFAQDVESHLLLYILAQRQGDTATADRHFATAVKAMQSNDPDFRHVAAALAAPHPDAATLCLRHLNLESKRVLLTALGLRYPADRATYFAMARTLNFMPEFPRHLLATTLTE